MTTRTRRPSVSPRRPIQRASVRSVRFFAIAPRVSLATDAAACTGVLTKADLVQRGEHDSWLDLLAGRKNRLANGYFVTKQPAPEDLAKNLSFEDARAAEAAYFKAAEPWSLLNSGEQSRLGTRNLTNFLSERLGRYIGDKYAFRTACLIDTDHRANWRIPADCLRSARISPLLWPR